MCTVLSQLKVVFARIPISFLNKKHMMERKIEYGKHLFSDETGMPERKKRRKSMNMEISSSKRISVYRVNSVLSISISLYSCIWSLVLK